MLLIFSTQREFYLSHNVLSLDRTDRVLYSVLQTYNSIHKKCSFKVAAVLIVYTQSIIVFCPRTDLSLQTLHSPLYPPVAYPEIGSRGVRLFLILGVSTK